MKLFINILRLLRPRQWIKNLAIFSAIVFNGHLFDLDILIKGFLGFLVFCTLSSSVYIINDYFDIKKDRLHPFKRFRPLAHNDVPLSYALFLAACLTVGSFGIGYFINPAFLIIITIYLALQFSYSVFLKHIVIIDILAIAAGYILRVYAGEFASGFHIPVWLSITTICFSLFLAVGKRKSELTLISGFNESQKAAVRRSLSHYSDRLLDVYLSIFATTTFISYTLFTFSQHPAGFKISLDLLMPDFLPQYFQRKWLMITILPVVYGLMRYLQDIYEKHEGESPERMLLSDKPLIITVIVWILLVIGIIYVVGT